MLNCKIIRGNVGIKFDIAKAFDTIDWGFLLQVLHMFGVADKFVGWIDTILHSACLSIAVNGALYGYFPYSRGVCQGDPLSSLMFCIAEDVLSCGITHLINEGRVWPMSAVRKCRSQTHMMYANDIMVFCMGYVYSLTNLIELFQEYDNCSGQIVSKLKLLVFIVKGTRN